MKKRIIIFGVVIIIILAVTAFFVFHHHGTVSIAKGTLTRNASAVQQQFSGLNLNPGSAQSDATPLETSDIPQLS